MYLNKIIGIVLGIIVSYLFYLTLSQRSSIIIGNKILTKYNDCDITCNNRCGSNNKCNKK